MKTRGYFFGRNETLRAAVVTAPLRSSGPTATVRCDPQRAGGATEDGSNSPVEVRDFPMPVSKENRSVPNQRASTVIAARC
jgi:hypothetical protein